MADSLYGLINRQLTRPVADRILLITGEESGDVYAGTIMRELSERIEGVKFEGIGGKCFREAGGETLYDIEQVASVGLGAALGTLGLLREALLVIGKKISDGEYDAVILIDFPDFNLRIAKIADTSGTPVFYYVCPQIWAWRRSRINSVRKWVDMAIVALPFEEEFYTTRGVDARFVGHPILDELKEPGDIEALREEFGAKEGETLIGVLPGSREGEVARMASLMFEAVRRVGSQRKIRVVVACADSVDPKFLESFTATVNIQAKIIKGRTWQVMRASDFLICKSGTSTLLAALAGTPMVIVYKADFFTYLLAKSLSHVQWAGLPNLIADKEIVPELIQFAATSRRIADKTVEIISDKERLAKMSEELKKVRESLGEKGAAGRAADAIVEFLRRIKEGAATN